MRPSILLLTTGAISLFTAVNLRAGELLVNGDFENMPNWASPSNVGFDGGFTALTGSQIPGWTVASGHAATVHISPGPYAVINGHYSINTDGEGYNGHNADLYQDFATTAGASYKFSYNWEVWLPEWMQGHDDSQLHISIEDLTTSSSVYDALWNVTGITPFTVQPVTANILGNGDTYRVEIQQTPETGVNDNKYIVDDFSVQTQDAPEVTTWWAEGVAACALLAAGLAMRRNAKTR